MSQPSPNNRSKKFLKDFGVYAIGVVGNRLITFFLIPFYTYFIDRPGDYGIFDLCLNLSFLLFPLISLQLRDGMFRFLLDSKERSYQQRVVTFGYVTLAITLALSILFAVLLSLFTHIPYLWYTTILVISMAIAEVTIQTVRGLGHNKLYVEQSLLTTFLIAFFSVIFLLCFSMNIDGIFIANILARFVATAVTMIRIKLPSNYFIHNYDYKKIGREILRYTLPLLPVAMCWWFTTSSDRFFIKHFLSAEMNGQYAVAVRFAGVITTLAIIFYQTWQENAIQQYNSDDRDSFFSTVFNNYVYVLVIILTIYTFVIKLCYGWLVAPNYQESRSMIYLSGVAAVMYSLATYFDLPYQCAKETSRAIKTVVVSALVSLCLNLILVRWIGVFGVIITSIISYITLIVYRWCDTRRYFTLTIYKKTTVPLIIMALGAVVFHLSESSLVDVFYVIAAISVIILFAPEETKQVIMAKVKRFALN